MAPWDRVARRRNQARIQSLPTRIASAQPIADAPNLLLRSGTTRQPWQDRARVFGKELGVVRFSAGITASAVSRCALVAERRTSVVEDRWVPDKDPIANGVLRTYNNPRDTTQELVRRHAWHYQIVGECLQTVEQGDGRVNWYIYATAAAQIYPQRPVLVQDIPGGTVFNGGAREVPPEQVNRFWTADEDYPLLATSPLVAILDDCERYTLLGRRTKREAKSALGLNGLLYSPESAHTYPTGPDGKPALYSQMDQDLAGIAQKAWDDDDSPAATSPYSVHYGSDKETAIEPKWIDVGKALDPKVLDARREALECIVRGLPIPNVLGIEGSSGAVANHWNGWLISEEFFKGSVAPVADVVYHSDLTASLLRPSLRRLQAAGHWSGNPDDWRVGYDPTAVIIHPDKAGRAIELYKEGAISKLTTLLESGFGPEDAPSPEELAEFIAVQQAIHARTPLGATNTDGAPPAPVNSPTGPQTSALAPYPSEVDGWLDDARAVNA